MNSVGFAWVRLAWHNFGAFNFLWTEKKVILIILFHPYLFSGPWSEHGTSWYNCNRYDEKSSHEARDSQTQSRASLERYLHVSALSLLPSCVSSCVFDLTSPLSQYYNRFANHQQSAKLDQDLYRKTEKKMEEMQQTSDLSWIEVQFLKKAVDTLTQCRMTLKWTYAFAFYLSRTNETVIFEVRVRQNVWTTAAKVKY